MLALWYVEGWCRLLFRFVADPEQCVEVSCERGTTVLFDNTVLEHSVPTRAHRAFFGPFLVRGAGVPPTGVPRGGELCCWQGVETCCGNMCSRSRAQRAGQLRRADAPVFLRHAFTYQRARAANARIQLVEQHGDRRVRYNGEELHGSWHWLFSVFEANKGDIALQHHLPTWLSSDTSTVLCRCRS